MTLIEKVNGVGDEDNRLLKSWIHLKLKKVPDCHICPAFHLRPSQAWSNTPFQVNNHRPPTQICAPNWCARPYGPFLLLDSAQVTPLTKNGFSPSQSQSSRRASSSKGVYWPLQLTALSPFLPHDRSKPKLLRLGEDLAHVRWLLALIVMLVLFPWLRISLKELRWVLISSLEVLFLDLH